MRGFDKLDLLIINWMTLEGDSGGPLIRYAAVTEEDGSPGYRAHLVGEKMRH